ncbi:MAG TPA: SprT-like domain-containing protein, partial [Longimicrobiaceae bacterium]|nr:SprT-like domain-containing protein [Longimicrobiaceae bacterium]
RSAIRCRTAGPSGARSCSRLSEPVSAGSLLQRLLGTPAGEPLLKQVRAGGAGSLQRVVFTRNRRVMVSVGDRGKTLRLHESFREAPPEVLRAIGRLLSRTPAAERQAAREVVRGFLAAQLPATPPAPRPRRRRIPAADRPVLARLQAEFDAVNADYFGGSLPRVPLALSGRMKSRNGHFSSHPPEIVLSRRLCQEGAEGEAEKTLRHEMIHLWQHAQGRKPGHGRDFRRWAERLGVHPRATRSVEWKGEG